MTGKTADRIRGAARWLLAAAVLAAALGLVAPAGWSQNIQIVPGQQGRLRADRVRYDARAQVLIAEGHVHLTLGALELRSDRLRLEQKTLVALAEGTVSVRQPEFSLGAARVRYDIRRRSAQAEGGTILTQGDLTVRAGRMKFELDAQLVAAAGGVTVTQGTSTLTGTTLQVNLKAKRAEVVGEAQLVRTAPVGAAPAGEQPREETVIRATRLQIRWDVNEAQAEGGVSVRRGTVAVRAQQARYSEAADRLDLDGGVVVEEFGDQSITAGATLACERLVVFLRERDMEASGKVTVTQKGRTATGERGAYSEKAKRIVLTGGVQLQDEEGNVIRADRVVIDLEDETFEASGNVETIFKVQRGR